MIIKFDENRILEKKKELIIKEFLAFNADYVVANTKEYYLKSYNGSLNKYISKKEFFSPNFLTLENPDKKLDKLSLKSLICAYYYFDENDQVFLEHNKSIINQYLFLSSVLRSHNIRLVVPNTSYKTMNLTPNIFWSLTAYGCDVVFKDTKKDYVWKHEEKGTFASGVHFEAKNEAGDYVICGYNTIVYKGLEPIAINFVNNLDVLTSISNNKDVIEVSPYMTDIARDFSKENEVNDRIIDALISMLYIYQNKKEIDKEDALYRYAKIIASVMIYQNISYEKLNEVLISLAKKMRIYNKIILSRIIANIENMHTILEFYALKDISQEEKTFKCPKYYNYLSTLVNGIDEEDFSPLDMCAINTIRNNNLHK